VAPPGAQPVALDAKEEGVTCVVCHGTYAEWIKEHQPPFNMKWPNLSRAQKEARFGMRDLWDPGKRAQICLSCHVGDIK
jgi:hypothetical protein